MPEMTMLDQAIIYAEMGWHVFPVPPGSKQSYLSEETTGRKWGASNDPKIVRAMFKKYKRANIGIVTGPESGIFIVDADTAKGHAHDGVTLWKKLLKDNGGSSTLTATSPTGSLHTVYQWQDGIRNSAGLIGEGIDVRGSGGMFVAAPSVTTKGTYTWTNWGHEIAKAPAWLIDRLKKDDVNPFMHIPRPDIEIEAQRYHDALDAIANEDVDWESWNRIGMATWAAFQGSDEGFEAFDKWSRKSNKYDETKTRQKWKLLGRSPPKEITGATLLHLAKQRQPAIRILPDNLSDMITQVEDVWISRKVQVYRRGGVLVHPVTEKAQASRKRTVEVARLAETSWRTLQDFMASTVRFEKFVGGKKGNWIAVNPPDNVAQSLLDRGPRTILKRISGVISCPTMRSDGSILQELGYDDETELFLAATLELPPIGNTLTAAKKALKLYEDLLAGYPFKDNHAKAVAIAAIVSVICRGAFPRLPIVVISAPIAGSGKSHLTDLIATIATGKPMPVMALGKTEEETEKRLGASLMTAQAMHCFDNVNEKFGGTLLCQAATATELRIRRLGMSRQAEINMTGVALFANGNNIELVGDIVRRCMECRLDTHAEQPHNRKFSFDPVKRVLADRAQYVAAGLTICSAYMAEGRPDRASPWGSFDEWSDLVRSALLWLGCADPMKTMSDAWEADSERSSNTELFDELARIMGTGERDEQHKWGSFKVRDLVDLQNALDPNYARLNDMLRTIADRFGKFSPDRIGKWLRNHRGVVLNDKRLEVSIDNRHGSWWWIENGERNAGFRGINTPLSVVANEGE